MVAPFRGTGHYYFWPWASDYLQGCSSQLQMESSEVNFLIVLTFPLLSTEVVGHYAFWEHHPPCDLFLSWEGNADSWNLTETITLTEAPCFAFLRDMVWLCGTGYCFPQGPAGKLRILIWRISQWLNISFSLFRLLPFQYLLILVWKSTVISPQCLFQAELYLTLLWCLPYNISMILSLLAQRRQ